MSIVNGYFAIRDYSYYSCVRLQFNEVWKKVLHNENNALGIIKLFSHLARCNHRFTVYVRRY